MNGRKHLACVAVRRLSGSKARELERCDTHGEVERARSVLFCASLCRARLVNLETMLIITRAAATQDMEIARDHDGKEF